MTQRLIGRIALVTGASRGIGAAVARRFAAEGAQVVLVARTVGGLEEVDDAVRAQGGLATLLPLDLADAEAIDRIGPSLHQRFGRLDIVVGNAAAIGPLSPAGHVAAKDWDRILAVNLTANWRLLRTLDPLLRDAEAGRAIFVTCAAASAGEPFWGAYAASKAGLEMLVRTYAAEVAATRLRVNLVDPGVVGTRLRASGFPLEEVGRLRRPEEVTDGFVDLAAADCTRHGDTVRLPPA